MKKLFTIAALIVPMAAFATPAQTNTDTAPLAVNFKQIRDLNTLETYHFHRKGRSGDSGIRSMDYVPFNYNNESLVNKLYKKNIIGEIKKPGVVFQEGCYNWKNCLQNAYRATNRYENSIQKFKPAITSEPKALTRGNFRGAKNMLDGERSGLYKIERWGR